MVRLIFLLFLIPGMVSAQPSRTVGVQSVEFVGARGLGLGGATTALRGELWGLNPALVATQEGGSVAVYGDQGFGLEALRKGGLRIAHATGWGVVTLGGETFGFEQFRETGLRLGFARNLQLGTSRPLSLGLAARFQHVRVEGYGSGGALALDAGLLVEVFHGLDAGFRVANLNAGQIAGREDLPRLLSVGLAYHRIARLLVAADVVKDTRHPAGLSVGLEAEIVPALSLRAGTSTSPRTFSAGMGLRLGKLGADLAATRHDALGWTPAVGVGLRW